MITHDGIIGRWPLFDLLLLAYVGSGGVRLCAVVAIFQRGGETIPARAPPPSPASCCCSPTSRWRSATSSRASTLGLVAQSGRESYAWSIVWLVYAVALLALGIVFREPIMRYAALGILVIVALKVFLLDMSGLTGLYRVGSFLGLGLSRWSASGLVYQRFVFPAPENRRSDPVVALLYLSPLRGGAFLLYASAPRHARQVHLRKARDARS